MEPSDTPPLSREERLVGLDPGRSKCGMALAEAHSAQVLGAGVLAPEACWEQLQRWRQQGAVAAVVLGNGTGSRTWQRRLEAAALAVIVVPEAGTTLAARQRYWELEPPRGWRRLVPQGMRIPPRDYDDVVAQLLLERHLGQQLTRANCHWLRSGPAP